jgi:4'-phosphopantetheinyl transferase
MTLTGFTPLNSQNCILNESRIDLWQFSLAHELNITSQILNDEEKARGNRFYFERHRRRFTTARATLRIILARYLNMSPERLEFTYNLQGKPSAVNSQKLQFNLSHTGDLALLAVGKVNPIGVDIERYSARSYEGIAKNLFSPQELQELHKAPPARKAALFFHIWAQKEAFIKASGLGLSYPTQEFSVPTSIPTKQLVDDPINNTTWQLHSFMPQVACSGALCYHPTVRELRHGVIQLHETASSLQF